MKALQLPTFVAKTLIPHEPLKLPEVLATADALDLPDEHPIAAFHREVTAPLGLNLEATAGPCIAAISAAAGPSIQIRSGGRILSSSLNLVVVGGRLMDSAVALLPPFEVLREHQQRIVGRYQDCPDELDERGAELMPKFQKIRETRKAMRADPPTKENGYGLFSPFKEYYQTIEARLQAEEAELMQKSQDLMSRMKPLLLVESCSPEKILEAKPHAFDGGVFHLDTVGEGLGRMLAANPKIRNQVLDSYVQSFDRSLTIKEDGLATPPWLSTMAWVHPAHAINLLLDPDVGMRAFATRCLYIALAEFEGSSNFTAAITHRGERRLDEILMTLIERKRRMNPRTYHVDPEGEKLLAHLRFSLREVGPAILPVITWWHDIALKVALLFHVGETDKPEKTIPAPTVQAAISYVCHAGGRGLKACFDAGGMRTKEDMAVEDRLVSVVSRIYEKGPMTRRDIQRSISGMKKADLDPVVALAIERGALVEKDGVLRLKGQ